MTDSFVENVRELRRWQRAFFKSPPQSAERKKALDMSRLYEMRVDKQLEEMEQAAAGLFAEEMG